MTALKQCPDCPTYAVCEHCGASHDTRPAPELPEGYTGDGSTLYDPDGRAVARWYGSMGAYGITGSCLRKKDAQALAIWLQRRGLER